MYVCTTNIRSYIINYVFCTEIIKSNFSNSCEFREFMRVSQLLFVICVVHQSSLKNTLKFEDFIIL